MIEFTPHSSETQPEEMDGEKNGLPHEVFDALKEENLRLPQSFAFVAPAVAHTFFSMHRQGASFEELFKATLSEEQKQELANIATRVHGKRNIMDEKDPTKAHTPSLSRIKDVWAFGLQSVSFNILNLVEYVSSTYEDKARTLIDANISEQEFLEQTAILLKTIEQNDPDEFALLESCVSELRSVIDSPEAKKLATRAREVNDKKLHPEFSANDRRTKVEEIERQLNSLKYIAVHNLFYEKRNTGEGGK